MNTNTQRPAPSFRDRNAVQPFMARADRFWQRITDGLELNQLWRQFQADARSSYRLYSREIRSARTTEGGRRKRLLNITVHFFWAVMEKLTPARRLLLLIALVLVLLPNGEARWHVGGGLLMFVLLVLELADRVVMKRDLQIAKEIQVWLLPAQPPSVPGLEIAFATRPANTVAGDYYDVFRLPSCRPPDEKFLIAVADVAGKSVPAAILMATFQASLKTLCTTPGSLIELAGRMNAYACTNSQNGRRFTTTFLAEYDPASHQLIYVNAGHNAPMLRRGSGAIERLDVGGMPLGIQEAASYQSDAVTLQAGDWLVIFTDGVIEAENERHEEYGEGRLLAVLHAKFASTPAVLLGQIMADLDYFAGNAAQHDDVTLMLLRAS